MTEKDHAQLTLLATGGLSRWQAAQLRKRLAQEPELAQAWDATQALHQQLHSTALPESTPAPPTWPSAQSGRPRTPFVFRPITFAYLFIAFSGIYLLVSYLWVSQLKQEEQRADVARLEGRWSVERTVEEAYRALAYNEKSAPRLLALGERTAKSSRNPYLLIERRKRKLLLAWKMIGHAQVTVTYANEKPEVITTRLPENAAKWKELTAYFPGLPQSERLTPEIIWNYGIGALAEGDRLRTTDDNFFSSSGGFSGYGTHTIKDLKGNVIATLEVKPVK